MVSEAQDVFLRNANGEVSRAVMYRALFARDGWYGGGANGVAWLSSTQPTREALARALAGETIGEITAIAHMDDHLAALDARAMMLKLEVLGPIAVTMDFEELPALKQFARGVRVERAMAARDYPRILAHDHYLVPYYGVLGQGHQIVTLPINHNNLIAAFTAEDHSERFFAGGTPEDQAKVKFVGVSGQALFGEAAPKLANGVIVNIASEHPFGFDLAACREIAAAAATATATAKQ